MAKPDGTYRTYDEMVKEGIATKYNGHFTAAPLLRHRRIEETFQFAVTARCRPISTASSWPRWRWTSATGKTTVLKMTPERRTSASSPAGRPWRARCTAAWSQGIGLALSEDFEDIEKHTNLIACGIPYIKDAPDALDRQLPGDAPGDRPVRSRRVRRAPADVASRRDNQRHLPRLRSADHPPAGAAGEGAGGPQGPRVANISFLCSLLRSPRRRREHSSILIGTSSE